MKKLTALFLALALCLSLCTVTAFAGTISTVADVLATVEGGFPTSASGEIPSNAWNKSGDPDYPMYIDVEGDLAVVVLSSVNFLITSVTPDSDNYVATMPDDAGTWTFTMEDGKLTSITITGCQIPFDYINGTYSAPAEATTYTATFTMGERVTGIQYKVNDGAFAEYTASVTNLVEGDKITIQVTCEEGYTYNGTTEFTVDTADINETINATEKPYTPTKPITPCKPCIPHCPTVKTIAKTAAVAKTIAVVKTVAVVKTIKSILKWF